MWPQTNFHSATSKLALLDDFPWSLSVDMQEKIQVLIFDDKT
jgi:hypothetical protein